MCVVSELVRLPAGYRGVPPPRLSSFERKRIELDGRRVDIAVIEGDGVVEIIFSREVPVSVEPNGVVPRRVCLLVHDALSRAASVTAQNLFSAIVLGPRVVVMPGISYVEEGRCIRRNKNHRWSGRLQPVRCGR